MKIGGQQNPFRVRVVLHGFLEKLGSAHGGHTLIGEEESDGHRVWVIESVPHEDAAVVWGKEVLVIRDDFVLMEEQYWDQDGELVKVLETLAVAEMGGRAVARVMRMGKVDTPDEWTEMVVDDTEYDVEIPGNLFTLSNLRNPRD